MLRPCPQQEPQHLSSRLARSVLHLVKTWRPPALLAPSESSNCPDGLPVTQCGATALTATLFAPTRTRSALMDLICLSARCSILGVEFLLVTQEYVSCPCGTRSGTKELAPVMQDAGHGRGSSDIRKPAWRPSYLGLVGCIEESVRRCEQEWPHSYMLVFVLSTADWQPHPHSRRISQRDKLMCHGVLRILTGSGSSTGLSGSAQQQTKLQLVVSACK